MPSIPPPALLPLDHAAARIDGVRRIAVLRANGLGDYVVSEPALTALRDTYPEAEITLLGAAHHAALLAGRPGPVDRVVRVPPVRGVRVGSPEPDADEATVEAWAAERRAERYDLAFQLHGGGGNSNRLLLRLGARTTVGAATPDAPKPDRWVPYTAYQHDTLRWLEVVAAAGAHGTRLQPRLAVTEEDLAASRAAVPEDDRPIVVVHPGATDPRRCYPEDRLGRVARSLADRGARVVVVAGESEAARAAEVVRGYGGQVEAVVGGLPLPGLVGLLARADLVLANDSGPRHIAAAVGTPTVAVFTAANLADVAPLVRTWHRVLVSWRGGCRVCGRGVQDGWCAHGASATHDVPEHEVRAAALELWEQVAALGEHPGPAAGGRRPFVG